MEYIFGIIVVGVAAGIIMGLALKSRKSGVTKKLNLYRILTVIGAVILLALVLFFINNYYTIIYRSRVVNGIKIPIPAQFYKQKAFSSGAVYFSTINNLSGLDDSIGIEIINQKFDRANINTVGGILEEEYIFDKKYGNKDFVCWTDGDAGYGTENFVYAIPGKDKYLRIRFIYNAESTWSVQRDEENILTKIAISSDL